MTLLVDTCVWSLALRRDAPKDGPEVQALSQALGGAELIATTGLILQELLQGVLPSATRALIAERFAALEFITPARADYEAAADLRNTCRAHGVQLGTIDALIAQLAIARGLTLLTADADFAHASRHVPVRLWRST